MSGLLSFWNDADDIDYNESLLHGKNGTLSYSTSTEEADNTTTTTTNQVSEWEDNNDHKEGEDNEDDDEGSIVGSKETSTGYTPTPVTFAQWKLLHRHSVVEFVESRVIPHDDDGGGSDVEDSDNLSGVADDLYETEEELELEDGAEDNHGGDDDDQYNLETQDSTTKGLSSIAAAAGDGAAASGGTTGTIAKPPRRRRIPCLQNTLYSIDNMQQIGMYTKDLTIELCRVTKYWRFRKTKRAEGYQTGHHEATTLFYPGKVKPRMAPHSYLQEDGPLGSCYKHVISFEVEQLQTADPTAAGRLFAGMTNTDSASSNSKTKRLRIFFYNQYAESIRDWFQQNVDAAHIQRGSAAHIHQKNMFFAFHQIPAICIFPFALDPNNLRDQMQMLNYCVCIGGKSSLKMAAGGEDLAKISFDRPHALEKEKVDNIDDDDDNGSLKPTLVVQAMSATTSPKLPTAPNRKILHMSRDKFCTRDSNTVLSQAFEKWKSLHFVEDENDDQPMEADRRDGSRKRGRTESRTMTTAMMDAQLPKRQRTEDRPIAYTKLSEVHEVCHRDGEFVRNAIVLNIYAVVLGFQSPKETRRGQWSVAATLIDDSESDGDHQPFTIVIFMKQQADLPSLRRTGDVLRMHRVNVQKYDGAIQLVGLKPTSYVVIRKCGDDWSYLSKNREYSFTDDDKERSQQLWLWGQKRIEMHPTINPEYKCSVAEVRTAVGDNSVARHAKSSHLDLTAMVVGKIPVPHNQRTHTTPRGYLRIWDGTGTAGSEPLPIPTATAYANAIASQNGVLRNGEPSVTCVIKISHIINQMNDDGLNPKLDVPKALCGSVVNVMIWEDSHWHLICSDIPVGTFIRMRNVEYKYYPIQKLRCLGINPISWISILPDQTYEVKSLLEAHDRRVQRRDPCHPRSGFLPLQSGLQQAQADAQERPEAQIEPQVPALSGGSGGAMDAVSDPSGKENPAPAERGIQDFLLSQKSTFAGNVRIMQTVPPLSDGIEHLCVPVMGTSGFEYKFGIRIRDETGELTAMVHGNAGQALLGVSALQVMAAPRKPGKIILSSTLWKAEIQGITYKGRRFFVLRQISLAQQNESHF